MRFIHPLGKIVIGNFGPNPSRGVMGCAGWILYERTADELLKLAHTAGVAARQSWVASEENGVNLFLLLHNAGTG